MTVRNSRSARALVSIALLLAGFCAGAAGPDAEDLAALRKRIGSLEQEIKRAAKSRPTAGKALKEAEVRETEARAALRELRGKIAAGREREAALRAKMSAAEARIAAEREALGAQLRIAYVAGREEWLRLALSQQDPVALSRRLNYYRYVTRERSALLARVQQDIEALQAAAAELREELDGLAELARRQEARVKEVTVAREVRATALATLERDLGSRQKRLEQLRREARALQDLMNRLARESRAAPKPAPPPGKPGGDPLPAAQLKDLPLRGRAVARFGQPRADGLMRWEGMMLAAPAGTEVRAVRNGRVVYADWLPGMGLLLVLDHGGGYMSLYGHNQELARAVGQSVKKGEVVARVGDSGGAGSPGLYFEVRRNGKPVDPRQWVR